MLVEFISEISACCRESEIGYKGKAYCDNRSGIIFATVERSVVSVRTRKVYGGVEV